MSFWSALGQVASRNHSLHHDFSLRGRVQGAREGTANNQQAGRPARRRRRRSRPRAAPPEGCEVEEETAENQWRRRPPRRVDRRLGVRFGTLPACGMRWATGFRGPDRTDRTASPRSRPGSVGAEDPSSQGKHRTIPNARCVIHPRLPFPCSQGFSAETRPGQQTFRAAYRLQWLQLYPALPAKMQIGHQPDQLVCRRRFLSRLDDLLTTASVRRPVWWAWHAQMRTELKYSS